MRKPWDSVKLKILLGYFSLAGIAAFTVWLIYSEVNVYTDSDSRMTRLNSKILYFTSVLTNLYQAEALERSYSQTGSTVHYRNYEKLMNEIFLQFDTLSRLTDNPAERVHNDSIVNLLEKKRANLKELSLLKKSSSDDMYARAMDRFNINKDSINALLNIKTIITDKSESTFVEQKKKNFFERLRYAFNPGNDSIFSINKQQIIQTDTIINEFNTADSVIQFLTSIMLDIKKENENSELQLARKQKEVLANDRTITVQLRQMLSLFEKDIFINSLRELNTLQERIRMTTGYLIALGVLALVIIILFIILILKDITRSQRYRYELEIAKAYSDTLLKSKEQIMLSITHDIKSPLASVMGYARLMNEADNRDKRQLYLDYINKSGDHILKLVTDLVDLTRLETGKLKFEYKGFNLYELVNDSFSSFYPEASARNLDFTLKFDIPPENEYYNDPVRIKQVIGNIISNAIKYTHSGSVMVHVTSEKINPKSEKVIFKVHDTGIGISEEHSRIIFNEFTRVSDEYDGAGLGLSISRRIVALLDGDITLESEPGKGSLFTIALPLLIHAKELSAPVHASENTPKKRVLLIDDDLVFLNMTAELLAKSGFIVDHCTSAMDAVSGKYQPDIIITDLQMPMMNGMDVISYLQRKSGKMVPVILLTGTDSPDTGDALFSAILKKSVTPDELISVIENVIKKVDAHLITPDPAAAKTGIYRYSLDQIRQFALDDHESVQRILTSFAESSYENLIVFDKYIRERDRKLMADLAHKMIAMYRQLDARKIVDMLRKIEREYESMSEDEWLQLTGEALNRIGEFINVFCEEQGIVV